MQGGVFIFSIENGKCALAVRALAVCARAARQECCCSLRCASSKELGVAPAHRVGEEYMEHGVTSFSSFLWEDRKRILECEKHNSFFRVALAVALMPCDAVFIRHV